MGLFGNLLSGLIRQQGFQFDVQDAISDSGYGWQKPIIDSLPTDIIVRNIVDDLAKEADSFSTYDYFRDAGTPGYKLQALESYFEQVDALLGDIADQLAGEAAVSGNGYDDDGGLWDFLADIIDIFF